MARRCGWTCEPRRRGGASTRGHRGRAVKPPGGVSRSGRDPRGDALRRLTASPASLSPGDRATIAYLVALQTMRTPSAAAQITRVANTALKTAASELLSEGARSPSCIATFHPNDTDEAIEEFRERVLAQIRAGEIRLDGTGGAAFATAFQHAIESVPIVIACHWTLLRSSTGGVITSDRAYAIHDPSRHIPWAAQGLLSSERVEVTIPLSDSDCLLVSPGFADAALDVREVSADELKLVNLRTYGWAQTYVFGKSQATLQAVRVEARRQPARVIRPKAFCQLVLLECDLDDNSVVERTSGEDGRRMPTTTASRATTS